MKPRTSILLDRCSETEPCPQPLTGGFSAGLHPWATPPNFSLLNEWFILTFIHGCPESGVSSLEALVQVLLSFQMWVLGSEPQSSDRVEVYRGFPAELQPCTSSLVILWEPGSWTPSWSLTWVVAGLRLIFFFFCLSPPYFLYPFRSLTLDRREKRMEGREERNSWIKSGVGEEQCYP